MNDISMNNLSMINNSSMMNNSSMINNLSMVNNLSKINTTNCICFKNKTSTVQCNRKRVKGTEYCGIHLRAKTKNRFDTFLSTKDNTIKVLDEEEEEEYYEYSDFRSKKSCQSFSLDRLKNTMRKYNISFSNKMKKRELYIILRDFFVTLFDNKKHTLLIIRVQNWFRTIILFKRCKCQNRDDFYTSNSKFDVSLSNIFIIKDISNHYYWFEVDTFGNLLESTDSGKEVKNPYTYNVIDSYYIDKFKRIYKSKDFVITMDGLNDEQLCRNRAIEVFQKINKLDNYSDFNWFYDLSIQDLKKMYAICEDVWNYRAQLTWESKKNIVSDGFVFRVAPYVVQTFKNKQYIRDLLLHDFDRLCSEGKTIDDKKVGAMLILTSLVEVSFAAANAMPQYVQGANMY